MTTVVAATASPPPAMADKSSDAFLAGVFIAAVIAGAAAKKREKHRYDYSTDTAFSPDGMPGTTCYTRARTCYQRGNYSPSATQWVFG